MKKYMLLLSFIITTSCLQAQKQPSFNFSFNHIALSVTNLDSSVIFYTTILGLAEITNRAKSEGIRWLSLGQDKELHLISTVKEKVSTNKAIHIGIGTNQLDAFIIHLEKNNIVYSDWPGKPSNISIRADGVKQIYFQDPNGYWIEVNTITIH